MRTAAYYRVSTAGQGEPDKFGLPAQREAVQAFAATAGLEIVAEFEDSGYSGATADRPALAELVDRADEFERVVVYRWDRLARSTVLDGFLKYRLQAKGCLVLSATETNGIDEISHLTQSILAAVAQYERGMITARLANARKIKKARGGYAGGRPPFGYMAPGDGTLVQNPREYPILQRARDARNRGETFDQIVCSLNQDGYRSRTGRLFRKSTVHGMLTAQGNLVH